MAPCYMGAVRPVDVEHAARVLRALGDEVEVVEGRCCGQPAFNSGFRDEARNVGREYLRAVQPFQRAVMPSGSCVAMAQHYLPGLFDGRSGEGAARIAARVQELSGYVACHPRLGELRLRLAGAVVFHDSCHARRELGTSAETLALLETIEGLEVRRLAFEDECCGFGGTFSVKLPEVSVAMMTGKLDDARATGARVLVSSDLSCLLHLQAGADGLGVRLETWSIAELLSRALP